MHANPAGAECKVGFMNKVTMLVALHVLGQQETFQKQDGYFQTTWVLVDVGSLCWLVYMAQEALLLVGRQWIEV